MAVTGVSEFTFGYAFLYEQTERNWSGLKAAPVLPSLQQEADLGWDAHLPTNATDFYYQFKLSEYLSRANAKYIADGTYATPYYRVALHRRDNNLQHARLRQHCIAHPDTYYVAPEFSGLTDFNDSFLAKQITENSRLLKLVDCLDINDGEQHYITFRSGSVDWLQHSEAKRIVGSESGKDLEQIYRRSSKKWRAVDEGFAESLFEATAAQIRHQRQAELKVDVPALQLLDIGHQQRTRSGYLRRTADLLSIFYGLTLVLVGEPN